MKKTIYFAAILLFVFTAVDAQKKKKERSIGFNTMLPELKFHLGTEEAINVVKEADAAWAANDWGKLRTYFADTAKCYFPDGSVAESADEFISVMKEAFAGGGISWTFDYCYSVDLDPTRGGEHVQAGITGKYKKDGKETKTSYHEWYYVVEGKIVMWRQYKMDIKEKM